MEHEELVTLAVETDARSKSNTKRLDRLESTVEAIHELATNVALLAHVLDQQEKDIKEIKADVQALKAVPGKRWEQVVEKVIFGVVAAVLGALATLALTRIIGG